MMRGDWAEEVRQYLVAAAAGSMSRNNSEQLALELLEGMPVVGTDVDGYTHVKKPYRANCKQFDGTNAAAVIAMLEADGAACSDERGYILVRWGDNRVKNMYAVGTGDWVRRGQNGALKRYDDETFRLKYVPIPAEVTE